MRIPTSVIVMSLLTAAPFAMAVRDTVNGKDKPAVEDDDWGAEATSPEIEREIMAEYEAERARDLAAREVQREENIARLDTLVGPGVAQMGPLLAGVTIGAEHEAAASEDALDRIAQEKLAGFLWIDLQFDTDVKRLENVTVSLVNSRDYDAESGVIDLCATLKDKLVGAWGPSTNSVWVNAATFERATLAMAECSLTFERVLSPTDWVAAAPLDVLGKPADKTLRKLQTTFKFVFEENNEELATWRLPGTGFGRGTTLYEAYIENKKIVGVRIAVDTDFDSMTAIRDALSAKLRSQPTYDEDAETWTWKRGRASLSSYEGSSRVVILIGKDPYE